MIKTNKGLLLDFIKEKDRTTKEIRTKFGNGGSMWTDLTVLQDDGLIYKPKYGLYSYGKSK